MDEASSSATPAPACPRCAAPLSPGATAGLCPRCLLAMNLRTMTFPGSVPGSDRDRLPPPALEEMGARFPQFEFLEYLGRGGMGIVYKARQRALDRLVAIKILAGEWQHEPGFAERFSREARTLAKLAHPHIVTVHDFGEADGLYYLVMEYVDGVNLRDLLRDGKLEPHQALAIVPPVCEALQYAHHHGVVHRDIKPENLLLDREGRVKIADFGIATMAGDVGDISGTPAYMAPEQTSHETRPADHLADIYSLGAVLYEMLTGHLPPAAEGIATPQQITIDVRIDEIVLRALASRPEARYQSAGEMATVVRTVAATLAPSHRTPPPYPRSQPANAITVPSQPQTRLPAETTGLILLFGGAAALSYWLFFTGVQDSPEMSALLVTAGAVSIIAASFAGKSAYDRIRRKGSGSEGARTLAILSYLSAPLALLVLVLTQAYSSLLELLAGFLDVLAFRSCAFLLRSAGSSLTLLAVALTAIFVGLRVVRVLSARLQEAAPLSSGKNRSGPASARQRGSDGRKARAGLFCALIALYLMKMVQLKLLPGFSTARPGLEDFADGADGIWIVSQTVQNLALRAPIYGLIILLVSATMALGFASLRSRRAGDHTMILRGLAMVDVALFPLLLFLRLMWTGSVSVSQLLTGSYQPEIAVGFTLVTVGIGGWLLCRQIWRLKREPGDDDDTRGGGTPGGGSGPPPYPTGAPDPPAPEFTVAAASQAPRGFPTPASFLPDESASALLLSARKRAVAGFLWTWAGVAGVPILASRGGFLPDGDPKWLVGLIFLFGLSSVPGGIVLGWSALLRLRHALPLKAPPLTLFLSIVTALTLPLVLWCVVVWISLTPIALLISWLFSNSTEGAGRLSGNPLNILLLAGIPAFWMTRRIVRWVRGSVPLPKPQTPRSSRKISIPAVAGLACLLAACDMIYLQSGTLKPASEDGLFHLSLRSGPGAVHYLVNGPGLPAERILTILLISLLAIASVVLGGIACARIRSERTGPGGTLALPLAILDIILPLALLLLWGLCSYWQPLLVLLGLATTATAGVPSFILSACISFLLARLAARRLWNWSMGTVKASQRPPHRHPLSNQRHRRDLYQHGVKRSGTP